MGKDQQDKYMILSFTKKILNIDKGGMILTNDEKFVDCSRPMIMMEDIRTNFIKMMSSVYWLAYVHDIKEREDYRYFIHQELNLGMNIVVHQKFTKI